MDDASTREYLMEPLDNYVKMLPKVQVLRNKKREGLIRSRLRGFDESTGDVVIFLVRFRAIINLVERADIPVNSFMAWQILKQFCNSHTVSRELTLLRESTQKGNESSLIEHRAM